MNFLSFEVFFLVWRTGTFLLRLEFDIKLHCALPSKFLTCMSLAIHSSFSMPSFPPRYFIMCGLLIYVQKRTNPLSHPWSSSPPSVDVCMLCKISSRWGEKRIIKRPKLGSELEFVSHRSAFLWVV